jgi:putative Mg2+ transporter-C (MgtC) family protein
VILGVTSAATIWVLASIGVIIPVAGNGTAIKMSLVVLAILLSVDRLERIFSSLTRGVHAHYSVWRHGEDRPSWWRKRYVDPGASNRVVERDP